MTKIKSRVISLLTMTALVATGTVPQAVAEALNDSSSLPETITESVVDKQNAVEELAYITGEIEDLRTRYSKTYEQSDGSRVSVVSAAPVHFYDEKSEEWEEYDNRLTYNEDTKNYESDENGSDMQVSLPEKIDEKSDIHVEADGYTVSVTPIDISSSSSKKINEKKNIKSKEKDVKEYSLEDYVSDAVLDGKVEYTQDSSAKIEYIFSGSELKENIVLSKIPQKKQTYSFRIKTGGLTAKLQKDNSVNLYDSDNKTVFVIPAPYMYDESFEFSDEIKTKLKKDGSEYILTYEPDYKWLTDEDRVYPVTIDPTVQTKQSDTYVTDTSVLSASSLNLSGNPNLYAGAMGNRNCVVDSYIKFKRPPVIDKQWIMSSAKLNLKTASDKDNKINAYRITSDWETDTVKANPPSVDSTILDVCSVPAVADTWVYWDITNTVYDWYNGGDNYGIKLSSPYAQNNQSVFYSADASESENIPYISVEYNTISSAQLENSRSVDIGRAGTATINDFSGNLTLTREDIGVGGNVMPVNISMIYNLNRIQSGPFGLSLRTNYNQMISYNSGSNNYYDYVCEDGSTVYFDYDEETGEYVDRSERGYTLTNNGTSTNDYVNITIKDSSEYEYNFDKYGRLVKITDTNVNAKPSIEIAYTGDYTKLLEIDYIKDGSGRKYGFNYTDGKLSDISYYGNTDTVLQKVSYEYGDSTSKVIYPDGKSVSYSWDKNCMTSACNTDNYRVDFEYTSDLVSLPKKVTAIKEYGSNGTKGGDISIEYSPYQTKYINNSTGDTETLVFNSDGDLISTYNSQGAVTVNEYAKSTEFHGVNSLVNTYQHKKSETNLLSNGELERGLSDWTIDGDTDLGWHGDGHPGDKNNSCVQINGTPGQNGSMTQEISVSGKAGDTFDVGGWAKANASPQNPFNIVVLFLNNGNISSSETVSFNPYCTDWQYAMKNVQAQGDYTKISIALNYSGQINEAYFDGIAVYKAESVADVTEEESTEATEETSEEETEPEATTSIGSDGSKTTVDETDGVKTVSVVDKYGNDLSSETVIDGVSLKDISEYSSSGNYLKSTTDSAGTKTSYTYDENTGNLNSVSVNNNPINYTYDNSGNIAKVMQSVSDLIGGTAIQNSYFYDSGDRLSKIIHNGFNYTFGYTEFGLLESIMAGNQSLINYSYDNNGILTKAQYGNGQTIDYEYNNDNNKAAIKQNGNVLYNYNYDEYGTLTSVTDNVSGRVTSYTTDDNGNTVTEEKGEDVYHKLYSTEDQSVEVVGDDTIITKTASDADWSKTYWESATDCHSTYLTETDKFGRTSSENLYKTSLDSEGKEVENSKEVLYNKEYTYYSPSANKTSDRVSKLVFTGEYDKTIDYSYDACGNILQAGTSVYKYDEAGQLKDEFNSSTGEGIRYYYDAGGNLVKTAKTRYGGESVGDVISTYTYGDSNWKDLLTAYNGKAITYDKIGNPLTYYNGTKFAWTMGRRLESATRSNGSKVTYTYNADGLLTSKKVGGYKLDYFWNGDKLTAQTDGVNTWYFRYDGDTPIGLEFNGIEYYYVTNLQGDIIAILDSAGAVAAEYEYDAWGNCTITKDTNTIAIDNPLRYRGYYYDEHIGLYYLQSRFYDSNTGRFINADEPALIGANGGMVSNNLFAYCDNDPVNRVDCNGMWCYSIDKYGKGISKNHPIKLTMMQRYNYNKKAMKKYHKNVIYGQSNSIIKNIKFINYTLKDVGCEIVATYNIMKLLRIRVNLADLILEFEMNNMYKYISTGVWGVEPSHLYKYFKAHKITYKKYTNKDKFISNRKSRFGIISFWNNNGKIWFSQGIHTIAYWYDEKKKIYYFLNFYNSDTLPRKMTDKEFKAFIKSKNHFIVGYTNFKK